jgi:hypothetical protein
MNATTKAPTDQQLELITQVMDNLVKLGKGKDVIAKETRRLTVKDGELKSEYELRQVNYGLKQLIKQEEEKARPKPVLVEETSRRGPDLGLQEL